MCACLYYNVSFTTLLLIIYSCISVLSVSGRTSLLVVRQKKRIVPICICSLDPVVCINQKPYFHDLEVLLTALLSFPRYLPFWGSLFRHLTLAIFLFFSFEIICFGPFHLGSICTTFAFSKYC